MDRARLQGLVLVSLLIASTLVFAPADASHSWGSGRSMTWEETLLHDGEPVGSSRVFEMEYLPAWALDEWGRNVNSIAFTFPTPRPVWSENHEIMGYEDVDYTFYFEAAGGRYLGSYDSRDETRAFAVADAHGASPWSYAALLIGVTLRGHDIGDTFAWRTGTAHLEPEPDFNHDGCAGYQVVTEDGSTPARVCLDGSDMPRFVHEGGLQGRVFERLSPSVVLPPTGTGLPPAEMPREPWDQTLALPGFGSVAVPPSSGADWAADLHGRVTSLMASTPFLPFSYNKTGLHASSQFAGIPISSPGIAQASAPPLGSHDFLEIANGVDRYYGTTQTLGFGAAKAFVPGPSGAAYEKEPSTPLLSRPAQWEWGGLDQLPESQVPAGVMQDTYFWQVPYARIVHWSVWPTIGWFTDVYSLTWSAVESCFDGADDSRFAVLSAVNGQLLSMGRVETHQSGNSSGCSWGFSFPMSAGSMPALLRVDATTEGIGYSLRPQ